MELGTNWKRGVNHSPPFSLELPRLYLNKSGLYSSIFGSKLEFRVFYKGGSKMDPPFGSLKNEQNEMGTPNES